MSSLASQLEMVARLEEERREEGEGVQHYSYYSFVILFLLFSAFLVFLFSVTLCAMRLGNNTGNVQRLSLLFLPPFFSFLSFLFSTRFSLIHPNL